jgi:hypothetical protein
MSILLNDKSLLAGYQEDNRANWRGCISTNRTATTLAPAFCDLVSIEAPKSMFVSSPEF